MRCIVTLITGEEFECFLDSKNINKPFVRCSGYFNGHYRDRTIATNAIISITEYYQ